MTSVNISSDLAIREQMPEFLRITEAGLRCGYSIEQSLSLVVEELADPLRADTQATLDDVAQGTSLIEALQNWGTRTPHPDLDLWLATVKVQKEVGGNLADKLQLLGQIMAQRTVG